MWIVVYALRRPYTIGVLAVVILLFGVSTLQRMPRDILPEIDIPIVNVVWTYEGLTAEEMASKITSFSEIAIFNNVDDLRGVHSETSNGIGLVRVELQPYAKIDVAIAQVTAISQTILRRMPQGTTPPVIVRYSAGSVPVLQLALSSATLTDAQLYDYGRIALRAQIQTIPGVRLTLPYGGQARQIMVDIDPVRLQTYGLSPEDVSRAVIAQNLTLPSGSLREGERESSVSLNASPETAKAFEDLPLRGIDGRVIFLRDVANVRDGGSVVTNIARVDGSNGVIVSLLKLGSSSTIDIVNALRDKLPSIRAAAPDGVRIEPILDQSIFVRAAMDSVVKEGFLVGALVAAVVFVFLGSYRAAFIVLTSIPLSIFASATVLFALGHSLNLLSLGGLSLAIGILVDNAVVEIENINRNAAMGKPLRQAILDGAEQIVFPEFVSTVSICIVFTPIFTVTGASRYIFAPLAIAVIAAMAASFLLSRTLVPTLAHMLLLTHGRPSSRLEALRARVEHALDALSEAYARALEKILRARAMTFSAILAFVLAGAWTASSLGREFFPAVDAGVMRLHLRVPMGTKVEETTNIFSEIQHRIREIIPAGELGAIVENVGKPDPLNLSWVESLASVASEGEMLIQLEERHGPTAVYQDAIRAMLRIDFPWVVAFFRSADIVGQTLNEGAFAAIDIRIRGRDAAGNSAVARDLARTIPTVAGAADVLLQQIDDWPDYRVQVDLARAAQLGVRLRDVADAVLVSLSSSATVEPNYWTDKGLAYTVAVQTPPLNVASIEDLLDTPVATTSNGFVSLRTIATARERKARATVSRDGLAPVFDVLVNAAGRDLGSVYSDISREVAQAQRKLKPGNTILIAGQAAAMEQAYSEMGKGLGVAILLVFLVMVVNFQSWLFPVAILGALPLTIAGSAFGLALTGSYLSTPALMGVTMAVGVATANSVLLLSFARNRVAEGVACAEAVVEAAGVRLRPIVMTACAMLAGMAPMALGLGEGGEQNAPLARAVIGGLFCGTLGTLFFVPVIFTFVGRASARMSIEHEDGLAEPADANDERSPL